MSWLASRTSLCRRAAEAAQGGFAVGWLPVDSRGILQFPAPHPGAQLVCLMLANHETGAIQPVRAIALSLPPGTALHCDAAQAVGKIPVNFRELGVTTLTASAHKFGGPKGTGVLITKRGTKLKPLTFGGHQERGRRPGTSRSQRGRHGRGAESCVRNMTTNRAARSAPRTVLTLLNRSRRSGGAQRSGDRATDVVPTTLNVSFPAAGPISS